MIPGVAVTVRAEMMNMLPAIENRLKVAIAKEAMAGGSFSSAIRGG